MVHTNSLNNFNNFNQLVVTSDLNVNLYFLVWLMKTSYQG